MLSRLSRGVYWEEEIPSCACAYVRITYEWETEKISWEYLVINNYYENKMCKSYMQKMSMVFCILITKAMITIQYMFY